MGGKDEKETKTKIRTQISNEVSAKLKNKISNFTKNINKSVNQSTMNVSNEMVNEFKSSSSANATASNLIDGAFLVASNGATVDFSQDAAAKLEMAAIVNILSSNEQKNTLANKVSAAIEAQIKNDSKLKSQLSQAAKIQAKAKKSKGFGNMVNNLVDKFAGMASSMMKSLTGGSSKEKTDTDVETKIRNKISTSLENEINNTNINENEFVNQMTATIKNSFKNMTQDECLGTAESRNAIRKIKAMADTGATIKVLQVAKADAIAKCISTKKIGNKALSGLTNDNSYQSALRGSNKSDSGAKMKQKATLTKEESDTDAINESLDKGIGELGKTSRDLIKEGGKTMRDGIKTAGKVASMGLMVILLPVIVIGLIIMAVVVPKLLKGESVEMPGMSSDDDEEMEGGFNLEKLGEHLDIPLAKTGLTLICAFLVLDVVLKKTLNKQN